MTLLSVDPILSAEDHTLHFLWLMFLFAAACCAIVVAVHVYRHWQRRRLQSPRKDYYRR